jgi:hypothetical protein
MAANAAALHRFSIAEIVVENTTLTARRRQKHIYRRRGQNRPAPPSAHPPIMYIYQ